MATVSVAPARPRRVVQMLLMLIAVALGVGGYALTTINRTGEVPGNLGQHIVILIVLAVVAEVGMHILAPYADPVILPISVALTGIGLAMIYRLDMSYELLGQDTVGLNQLIYVGIAITLAAIALFFVRDHRSLRRFTFTFGVASLILLLLPVIPGLGVETYGARVWIKLGPLSRRAR